MLQNSFLRNFYNPPSSYSPYPSCTLHSSPLIYICSSEDCHSNLFCETCISNQHRSHKSQIFSLPDFLSKIPNQQKFIDQSLLSKVQSIILSKNDILQQMNQHFLEGESRILTHFDDLKRRVNFLLDLAYRQYCNSLAEINQTSLLEIEAKITKAKTISKIHEIASEPKRINFINQEELQDIAKYVSKHKDKKDELSPSLKTKVKEIEDILLDHHHNVQQFDIQKFNEISSKISSFIGATFGLRESFQELPLDHMTKSYESLILDENYTNQHNEICSVRLLNKSSIATASRETSIKLWDTQSGDCTGELKGHKDVVWCLLSAYDGKYLISGSGDRTIKVWKPAEQKCKKTFRGHTKDVFCLEYLKNQKLLASGSLDASIKLWDMQQGKVYRTLLGHQNAVRTLKGFSNGNLLSGGDDCMIKLWDTKLGICLKTINGHKGSIYSMGLFNGEKSLISCSDDETLRVWDIEKGSCLQIIKAHEKGVRSLAINPGETLIATGGCDKVLKVWDLQSLKLVKYQENNDSVIRSVQFIDNFSILYGDKNPKFFKLNVV